jgi:hypothetical protein
MVEVDECILGPNAAPQFFPGHQFARTFRQGSQHLERLVLAADAYSILPQHPGLQIQFVITKTNARSTLKGHTHGHLSVFDAATPEIVLSVNRNSSVPAAVTPEFSII